MNNWQDFIQKIGENRFSPSGYAKLYLQSERTEDLIYICKTARHFKIPVYIFGTSSWLTWPTEKIEGLLVKNNCRRFDVFAISGKMKQGQVGITNKLLYAESGTLLNQLVRFSIEEGLSGLEYFLGMAGTLGGVVFTNRRYTPRNYYINDIIQKLTVLNSDNHLIEMTPHEFISQTTVDFQPAKNIIISALFHLTPSDKNLLWERGRQAALYYKSLK